jgi:oligosaccharide repeat unit polymerase
MIATTSKPLYDQQTSRQVRVAKRLLLIAMGVALAILMLYSYERFDSPLFEYQGMVTRNLPVEFRWAFIVLACVPLLILPIRFTRPSDAASWMMYLIVVMPTASKAAHISRWALDEILLAIVAFVAAYMLFEIVRTRINWTIAPKAEIREYWFTILLPVVVVLGALYAFSLSNFQVRISLDDVYDRRIEARGLVETGSLAGYLLAIMNRAGIPIMMVLFLRKRSWPLFAAMVLSTIALFSFDGQKFTLFLPMASALCYAISKLKRGWQGYAILGIVAAIFVASVAEQELSESYFLSAAIVHRLFGMPAQLGAYYLDFFSANPSVLMTNSAFNIFVDPIYNLSTPRLIGLLYFRDGNNANVNIWMSAFADFYYPGMFLVSFVAAGLFGFIDAISKNYRRPLAYAMCGVIAMIWTQGAMQTSLLSAGVLIMVAFVYVLRDPDAPEVRTDQRVSSVVPARVDRIATTGADTGA